MTMVPLCRWKSKVGERFVVSADRWAGANVCVWGGGVWGGAHWKCRLALLNSFCGLNFDVK